MPIHGLTTHRGDGLPPCIGKLFKGDPKREVTGKDGKKKTIAGYDLSHFRFEGRMPGVAEAFEAAYPTPESRRSINCRVLGYDSDSAFPNWYEFYSGSGLQRRCDGERIVLECIEGRYHNYSDLSPEARPRCKGCPARSQDPHLSDKTLCSKVGRLRIVINELLQAGFVGYVTVETHGTHDILELSRNLAAIDPRNFGMDQISSIPFVLQRVQKEVWTPREKGTRARDKKWMLQLLVSPQWVASRASTLRDRLVAGHNNPYLIAAESAPVIPVRALPESPRGTHPRGTDPMQTVYNFYRSLGLHPNHFSQHLRMDLQKAALRTGRSYGSQNELMIEDDIPIVVGVRLAEYGVSSGVFGETTSATYEQVYEEARQAAWNWLTQSPEILAAYREKQYGVVGMAWAQYIKELSEQLNNEFAEVSA